MPKLWTDTVATHREEVRQAVLDAAGELVVRHGLMAVSMSQLAEAAGIGRATLYKYFADAEEVLAAWHARQVSAHLADLATVAAGPAEASARLRAVLERYAQICAQRSRHGGDVAAALHRAPGIDDQHRQLQDLMTGLVEEAASAGTVRADVPAEQLAGFCLAATHRRRCRRPPARGGAGVDGPDRAPDQPRQLCRPSVTEAGRTR